MELWEFILLLLGIISLIHYISDMIFIYKNYDKFMFGYYEINKIIRKIELVIIFINIAIWLYKLIF